MAGLECPIEATALAASYFVARCIYLVGYSSSPNGRYIGVAVMYVCMLALFGYSIYTCVHIAKKTAA